MKRDYIFTQRGFDNYCTIIRPLKEGEEWDTYLCKETFKNIEIAEDVLKELDIQFEMQEDAPDYLKEKCKVKDIKPDEDGKIRWFNRGVIKGIGDGAIVLKLPGFGQDGPCAFASWWNEKAPKLIDHLCGREYDAKFWYNSPPKTNNQDKSKAIVELMKDL